MAGNVYVALIEFGAGHEERYRFLDREHAVAFLDAIAAERGESLVRWTGPLRQIFRSGPGLRENIASIACVAAGAPLPRINCRTTDLVDLAAEHGGTSV